MIPALDARWPARSGHALRLWAGEFAFYRHLQASMRGAERSIWITVSFLHPRFRFPDGASFWDEVDAAAARGVDVRLLFWRNPEFFSRANVFQGSPDDLRWLAARGSRCAARWTASAHPRSRIPSARRSSSFAACFRR